MAETINPHNIGISEYIVDACMCASPWVLRKKTYEIQVFTNTLHLIGNISM